MACCQDQVLSGYPIGYVKASDADEAIKLAAAERGMSDPTTLSRLAARKVREIG
jgi:hypothetical protein